MKRLRAAASRARSKVSLIDVGATFIVANAGTRAFFGTGIVPFLTEGWLTSPTPSWSSAGSGRMGSGSSYALSAAELVRGLIPGGQGSGASSYTYMGQSGIPAVITRNLKEHGPRALATVIVTPIAAKLLKRVAKAPIRDMNRLMKWSGLTNAIGVKV